jgi:hypothetical protein
MSPLGRHLTIGGLAALLQNYRPADPEAGHPKKIRPVAPTRPNGFVNHVAMVTKKIWIGRADWIPEWLALEPSPDSVTWEFIEP